MTEAIPEFSALFKISFIQKTDCISSLVSSFFLLLVRGSQVGHSRCEDTLVADKGQSSRHSLTDFLPAEGKKKEKKKSKKGVENATQKSKDLKKTSHNITRFLRGRNRH